MMKRGFQSVIALTVIGSILVIVYLPYVDLPWTVHTKAQPGPVQLLPAVPVSPVTYAETRPWSIALVGSERVSLARLDVVAITCAYLC